MKRDLREWSPCRIEIEMAGKVAEGCLAVTVVEDTDAPPPPDNEVHGAVLARLDGIYDQTNAWPVVRMRIDLLANAQAAIVYRDTNRLDEFDVVDLREFGRWGLRLFAFARTSRGLPSGEADFRIKEAVIFTRPGAEPVVGRIVETPSEVPVADAVVKNPRGRTLAKTRENGAFAVRVGKRDSPLAVEKPNYFVEAPLANPVEPFSTVRLRNLNPGPGAMIEAIPYGNLFVANIGFRGDALMVLVHDSDTNCSLRPLDLITRTVAPDLANFLELETGKDGLLSGFAECGDRLIGIKHWQGAVFDLTSGSPQWLTAITNHDGSPLSYPQGCTFDGEYLWFVENDVTNQRFGLCAFDLGRMSLWRRFTSLDRSISGLAWDSGRKQFWVSNTKGRVYGVSRQNLLRLGTVEMAQEGGSFAGSYTRLAWGLGYLWGLDQQNRRICKIKITD
ncbi:MAG: hypothetical protein KJ070_25970 [Verrucomicrobia bacterium]|nr:hypothetical protein [Verrucomicrobiota bacterium]